MTDSLVQESPRHYLRTMTHPADFLLPLPKPSSTTSFRAPPLDGSLSVPQLIDWHFANNKNHPVFTYDVPNLATSKSRTTKVLTYSDVHPAIHRAGLYVARRAGIDITRGHDQRIIVAMFAVTGEGIIPLEAS
jgi:hypothetical protein